MEVTGSDLDITVTQRVEAKVTEAGEVCVPGKALFEVLRSMPEGSVRLEVGESHRLTVRGGGAEFRLVGLDAEDFPRRAAEVAAFQRVPAKVLALLLARAAPAVSTDQTRQNLNCILVEGDGETVRAVATDGHRMVVAEEAGNWLGAKVKWMLPAGAVAAVRRLLDGAEGDVEVATDERSVTVRTASGMLVAQQGQGGFPDWRNVVPQGRKDGLRVNRAAFEETARRVGLVACKNALKLHMGEYGVRVEATDPEKGEAREVVEGRYVGAEAELGVNGRYLTDALDGAASEEVELTFGAEVGGEAMELRPVGSSGFRAIIMPMRV